MPGSVGRCGERVLEVGGAGRELAGVNAGERLGGRSVDDLVREEGTFAGERVDRVRVVRERMLVDRAPVAGRDQERDREEANVAHRMARWLTRLFRCPEAG